MSSDGRKWFEKRKDFVSQPRTATGSEETPDLLTRCPGCGAAVYNDDLQSNHNVCPECSHHLKISAVDRLLLLCDAGSIEVHDTHLEPVDALGFVDSKPYTLRIKQATKKTGRNEAFISVSATVEGMAVEIGSFDFAYMGGSMGSVVGEMITRMVERAIDRSRPAIIVSASGGARMQEGVLSLMQMAKTSAALGRLKDEAKMPYVSILTHPTTGGVAASFAMLGDIIMAEPEALIGFAGPRVIEQTIGEGLPEGFQTSEYLLEHGMLDFIVMRGEMKSTLARVLRQLLSLPVAEVVEESDASSAARQGS